MTDKPLRLMSGWTMLPITLVAGPALIATFVWLVSQNTPSPAFILLTVVGFVVWLIHLAGYLVVNPNEARVVVFFGNYVGTIREAGFWYGNPFYVKRLVSLRVQTFETGMTGTAEVKSNDGKVLVPASSRRQPSKVNDKDGTPIEIAAVVVYRVVNAAAAVLAVDDYEGFVHLQSDAALRNLASRYHYDGPETDEHSLRSHIEEVALQLKKELQDRMMTAGVEIQEARISYLAYAPEIAAAMLQRQQAGAIIAARQKIVEGAVGMVQHALELLDKNGTANFDAERRAALVGNLLVVLCSHSVPQPVLNTGSNVSAG
jgi:regulator of protease activity HflC (stomatin/prohibitin superfamily)